MPITNPTVRMSRDSALVSGKSRAGGREMVLKNLAELMLSRGECKIFKKALQHFRMTRSVTSLCTSLHPLITTTERLMLLVELSQHLPSESLRRDFHKICTLQFPKYHTFLRYFAPQHVRDGSKVIAQDRSGHFQVLSKQFERRFLKTHSSSDDITVADVTSAYDDSKVVLRDAGMMYAGPRPDSAPGTLEKSRLGGQFAPAKIVGGATLSLTGRLNGRPDNILGRDKMPDPRHKRVLLERSADGSLGVGIQGGKEYGTPLIVGVVEPGSQAHQQGLKIGDVIVDVNGTDVRESTHGEIVAIMRNAWNVIMTVDNPKSDLLSDNSSDSAKQDTPSFTELEVQVYPGAKGKLGCGVIRDLENGEIIVKSVEASSAASQAGLWQEDIILEIEGMNVTTLTDKQVAALIDAKRVLMRIRRKGEGQVTEAGHAISPQEYGAPSKIEREISLCDDVFSPLDFSSPIFDSSKFTFAAASTPRQPLRSRSEERILWSQPHDTAPSGNVHQDMLRRTETSPDIFQQVGDNYLQDPALRMYHTQSRVHLSTEARRYQSSQERSGISSRTLGPPAVIGHHAAHHYAIVYSVHGRPAKEIPSSAQVFSAHAQPASIASTTSRSNKLHTVHNRSRDVGSTVTTLTPQNRDLLLAVQSGVEKQQRALKLSLNQVPDDGDNEWKLW